MKRLEEEVNHFYVRYQTSLDGVCHASSPYSRAGNMAGLFFAGTFIDADNPDSQLPTTSCNASIKYHIQPLKHVQQHFSLAFGHQPVTRFGASLLESMPSIFVSSSSWMLTMFSALRNCILLRHLNDTALPQNRN